MNNAKDIEDGRRWLGRLRVIWLLGLSALTIVVAWIMLVPGMGLGARIVDLRHLLGWAMLLVALLGCPLRRFRGSAWAAAWGVWACWPGWWLGLAPLSEVASKADDSLRIGSANLLFGIPHPEPLGVWIDDQDLDVVALQEVLDSDRSKINWPKVLRTWKDRFPYQWTIEHPHFGLALLSRVPFEPIDSQNLDAPGDEEHGRPWRLDVQLDWGAKGTRVVVVHPPRPGSAWRMGERRRFYRGLGDDLAGLEGRVVVLGDLNATGASPLVRELLERCRLDDTRLGFGRLATWSPDAVPDGWGPPLLALDHIFTRGIVARARGVGPAIRSDHYPVHAVLEQRLPGD